MILDATFQEVNETLKANFGEVYKVGNPTGGGIVDQTYNPESKNAQSGKAVAEAIKTVPNIDEVKASLSGITVDLLENALLFDGFIDDETNTLQQANAIKQEKTTDYIAVMPNKKYVFLCQLQGFNEGWGLVKFYDNNKQPINTAFSIYLYSHANDSTLLQSYGGCGSFICPEGVEYVRISARTYGYATMHLYSTTNIRQSLTDINLIKGLPFSNSYLETNGRTYPRSYWGAKTTPYISVVAGKTYIFRAGTVLGNKSMDISYAIKKNSTLIKFDKKITVDYTIGDVSYSEIEITIPDNANCIILNMHTYDYADYTFEFITKGIDSEEDAVQGLLPIAENISNGFISIKNNVYTISKRDAMFDMYKNNNIRCINHRGYEISAPENTLSAFKLSKELGFEYVECDIKFTSDNIPVLLHDTTVDRTSNGTGRIDEMTLDEVKTLDFGSWKSGKYAGETIPTFEEFIIFCKRIGLYPYIEVHNISKEKVQILIDIVKRYDMLQKASWISFYKDPLNHIQSIYSKARLGLVTEDVLDEYIAWATTKKTDENEVFLDVKYNAVTLDFVQKCVNNNIPLEVWTVSNAEALLSTDPYISGYTSMIRANVIFYDNFG